MQIYRSFIYASIISLILVSEPAIASDLLRVSPVSSDILLLEFDDGHIDYYGENEQWWKGQDNKVYYSPLDIPSATDPGSYLITSSNHSDWGIVAPTQVGRKSKGVEFNAPNAPNASPPTPEYISEHKIYLELPKALQSGKQYTLSLDGLADNCEQYTFTFDETVLRSETVRVNQVGFGPEATKVAYLSHWLGDLGTLHLNHLSGEAFNIVRISDRQIVYSGVIHFRAEHDNTLLLSHNGKVVEMPSTIKNQTHADVAECDFSAFQDVGDYVVSVPTIGCSFPFEIRNSAVNQPFYIAMKGLFYQRAGIVRELMDGGVYPRDHHPDDVPHFYHPDLVTVHNGVNPEHQSVESAISDGTYPDDKPVTGIWGWYHDASDWDMYVTHFSIPLQLMLLYELAPDKFYDGEIGNRYKLHTDDAGWIDEGSNGIPDLLDEARWLVEYCKRARHALQDQGYGTGGVPGYIGREGGVGGNNDMQPSWDDARDWAITAENPTYTMGYAAIASWYANCLNQFHQLTNPGQDHPDYSMWIDEAEEAYTWSTSHGGTYNGGGVTGLHTIAAINLYIATGQAVYKTDVDTTYGTNDNTHYHNESSSIPYGFISSALIEMHPELNLSPEVKLDAANRLGGQADGVFDRTQNVALRYGGFDERSYGLGMFAVPKVVMPAVKHTLSNDSKYLDTVQHNVSYVLGGNQLNTVHMTQLGDRPQNKGVHHIDSWVLYDLNSKVYSWEPVAGVSTYFGHNVNWVSGVGSHRWTRDTAYPAHDDSPRSEMNFGNRESINGSEYTTHQTIVSWAFATGYLKAVHGTNSNAFNARPTVALNLSEGQQLGTQNPVLSANTSSDTRRVAYYYEWHYIGESTDRANDFAFAWDLSQTGLSADDAVLLTAVAYDDKGLKSWPSDEADANVLLGTDTDAIYPTYNNGGLPWPVPGRVEAEDYDTGGEGISYADADTQNRGGQYRIDESVDVDTTGDVDGDYYVGWTASSEWLQYTVEVQDSATYYAAIRVAGISTASRQIKLLVDGVDKTGVLSNGSTGDWQVYETLTSVPFALDAGVRTLRLEIAGSGFGYNVNWFALLREHGSFAAFINQYPSLSGDDALPEADPEGDGLSNRLEQWLDRNPTEQEFEAPLSIAVEGNNLELNYTYDSTTLDSTLSLLSSEDLTQWDPVTVAEDHITEDGDLREVNLPIGSNEPASQFYRLQVTTP